MGHHESQCSPAEAASDSLDFMQEIMKKVNEKNCEKYVVNIDQTTVFTSHSKTNFGDEKDKDSHHVYFHTGHKMGHSCNDIVCR